MSLELKQAAQQAIEAFDTFGDADDFATMFALTQKMNALRTAIQQATQPAESEPVGEPRARVELMKTGGNAGLSTRIIELDIATRERLRPGDLLYTHPAPCVPDGYALVPVTPTPEMENAFRQAFTDQLHKRRNQWGREKHTMSAEGAGLRAMLAAAPKEGGAA